MDAVHSTLRAAKEAHAHTVVGHGGEAVVAMATSSVSIWSVSYEDRRVPSSKVERLKKYATALCQDLLLAPSVYLIYSDMPFFRNYMSGNMCITIGNTPVIVAILANDFSGNPSLV